MTGDELLTLADNYLFGSGGMPKNEEKGYATLKQAADAGNGTAAERYAEYAYNSKRYEAAAEYFDKSGKYPCAYFESLWRALATSPIRAEEFLTAALTHEDGKYADAYCYIARLYAAARPQETADRKACLNRAVMASSTILTDEEYAFAGRERGVIDSGEFEEWWSKQNTYTDYAFQSVEKSREFAESIISANLEDKTTKAQIGKPTVKQMKATTPKVTLEYQPVAVHRQMIGKVAIEYSRATRYDGSFERNSDVFSYTPTFRAAQKHKNYYCYVGSNGSPEIPSAARLRVTPARFGDLSANFGSIFYESKHEMLESDALTRIFETHKIWRDSEQPVHVDKIEIISKGDVECICLFKPFWFFTYEIGKKSVTIRIDATNGDITYHFNNPFGEYREGDNVREGGALTSLDTHAQNAAQKKFSIPIFLVLTFVFPFVGGALYVLLWATNKIRLRKAE